MSRSGRLSRVALPLVVVCAGVGVVSADVGVDARPLPFRATGMHGILDASDPKQHQRIEFDTSTGIYRVDGTARNDEARRRSVTILGGGGTAYTVWAFDFENVLLGPSSTVGVRGGAPLVLLSKGDALLEATMVLDGGAGAPGGPGAGGGGGGGGGAIAVFAGRTLFFKGRISVSGGPGGGGDVWPVTTGGPTSPVQEDPSLYQGGPGGAGAVVLGAGEKVLFDGEVTALTGGEAPPGSLEVVGPVEFGRLARFNGEAIAADRRYVELHPALGTLALVGGGGGGGAGGGGLPEDNPSGIGYSRIEAGGGLAGPGGGDGGAGGYAIAGGMGGRGGNGGGVGTGSGGGGGGGGYAGTSLGPGLGGSFGGKGGTGGSGVCPQGGGIGGTGGSGGGGVPAGSGETGEDGTNFGSGGGGGGGGDPNGMNGGNGANADAGDGEDGTDGGASGGGGGGGGGGVGLTKNGGNGGVPGTGGIPGGGGGGGGGGGDGCGAFGAGAGRSGAAGGGGGGDNGGNGHPGTTTTIPTTTTLPPTTSPTIPTSPPVSASSGAVPVLLAAGVLVLGLWCLRRAPLRAQ